MREISRLNDRELSLNISDSGSWHSIHLSGPTAAYIFIGGLDYNTTESDIIRIFSQCGEVVDLNLVRDDSTGLSRGFAFLAYEDIRSTVLAVDNFNAAIINQTNSNSTTINNINKGRQLRVDHADKYRKPKSGSKSNSTAEESIYELFDVEHDSDYDKRRLSIWDYRKYKSINTANNTPIYTNKSTPFTSTALSSNNIDTTNDPTAAKILAKLADRRSILLAEAEAEDRQQQQKELYKQQRNNPTINSNTSNTIQQSQSQSQSINSNNRYSITESNRARSRSRSPHREKSSKHHHKDKDRHRDRERSRSRDRDRDHHHHHRHHRH